MALPVRPAILPAAQIAPRPDAGRLAAQKAFFQAALARPEAQASAAAPAAATAAPPQAAQASAPIRAPSTTQEPPQKILRPGSLLDIKV